MTVDAEEIRRLLKDPVIIRIVTVLDISSLSVLELFEYGMTRSDINYAMTRNVIKVDNGQTPEETLQKGLLVAGDSYYHHFLNGKITLTELGRFLLDCVKGCPDVTEGTRRKFVPEACMPPEAPHRMG